MALPRGIGPIRLDPAVAEVADEAVSADPDAAVTALEERADVVAAQAVARGEDADAAVRELIQAAAVGADPDAVVARAQQRVDLLVREAIAPGPAREGHVLEPIEPLLRPHPQAPLAVLEEGDHVVVGKAPLAAAGREPSGRPPDETLAERSDPEVAIAVLPDRARLVPGEPVRACEADRSSVLDAREAAPRPHPDRARLVLENRVHPVVGERVARPISDDLACVQPRDAVGRRTDPDVAAAVLEDGVDRVPERRRLFVADPSSLPEPPDSSAARTDPEAAVARLRAARGRTSATGPRPPRRARTR